MDSSGKKIVRLEQGKTLLLTGPLKVRLSAGSADCFGAPLDSASSLVVEGQRQQTVSAVSPSDFEIELSAGGSWEIVSGSTIPTGWTEALQIIQQQQGSVVIIGDADSGKSTLCTFLANNTLRSGLKVGVVDGDVGQSDVGPPTTVSSATMKQPIATLQKLEPESAFFIGDTTPSAAPAKVITSLVRLQKELAKSVDVVLLNTDGWVSDSQALRFKEELVHQIEPDLVLGIGDNEDLERLLSIISVTSLKVPSSKYVRNRTKDERKKSRETGYRRFLLTSKTLKVTQDCTTLRIFDRTEQSILHWSSGFEGYLAGLLDREQRLLAIGRIRAISERNALVETSTTKNPTFLEIGNILLSSSYEEAGYLGLH